MKNKPTTKPLDNKLETVVGIIVALATVAVVLLMLFFSHSRLTGKIAFAEEIRRGSLTEVCYTDQVKDDAIVSWYVNGVCQKSQAYGQGGNKLTFTPDKTGSTTLRVVCGRRNQSVTVNVQKPILTVCADDITMTYGDEMPNVQLHYLGLLEGDSAEKLNLPICCHTSFEGGCGMGDICFDPIDCEECDYEVVFQNARLTVLPRQLKIINKIEKQYDKTNELQNPSLLLLGVVEGDDVQAECTTLHFDGDNVGVHRLDTSEIVLRGKHCNNYVLYDELTGEITPKPLVLAGLTVKNKCFDGTTKAEVEKPGKLLGVVEGDSVAIGSLTATFGSAQKGTHKVFVKDVSLVGMDKDNYLVARVDAETATITQ